MTETTKVYTLRPLEATDVFVMAKIIHSIGVEEFKKCFNYAALKDAGTFGEKTEEIGLEIFFKIVDIITGNLPKCEKDIYTFLSNLSGMDKKQIEHLPMNVFLEMVIDVIKQEEFTDFFSAVSKLFK